MLPEKSFFNLSAEDDATLEDIDEIVAREIQADNRFMLTQEALSIGPASQETPELIWQPKAFLESRSSGTSLLVSSQRRKSRRLASLPQYGSPRQESLLRRSTRKQSSCDGDVEWLQRKQSWTSEISVMPFLHLVDPQATDVMDCSSSSQDPLLISPCGEASVDCGMDELRHLVGEDWDRELQPLSSQSVEDLLRELEVGDSCSGETDASLTREEAFVTSGHWLLCSDSMDSSLSSDYC